MPYYLWFLGDSNFVYFSTVLYICQAGAKRAGVALLFCFSRF
jgi:hypothetical protein